MGDNGRLFYFHTSEVGDNEVIYVEIDLEKAMVKGRYPPLSEQDYRNPEILKDYIYSRNLFRLPVKNEPIRFEGIA